MRENMGDFIMLYYTGLADREKIPASNILKNVLYGNGCFMIVKCEVRNCVSVRGSKEKGNGLCTFRNCDFLSGCYFGFKIIVLSRWCNLRI